MPARSRPDADRDDQLSERDDHEEREPLREVRRRVSSPAPRRCRN
jgi:hypothetical protein